MPSRLFENYYHCTIHFIKVVFVFSVLIFRSCLFDHKIQMELKLAMQNSSLKANFPYLNSAQKEGENEFLPV